MESLSQLGRDFQRSYCDGSGYNLSQTLSPIAPPQNPNKLLHIFQSTNYQNAEQDIRKYVISERHPSFKLQGEEADAWLAVYNSYWKAIGEILKAEAAVGTNFKVYNLFNSFTCDLKNSSSLTNLGIVRFTSYANKE